MDQRGQPLVRAVPHLSDDDIRIILRENYCLSPCADITPLPGWVDKNYCITADGKEGNLTTEKFVLKVLNAKESRERAYIDAQNTVMLALSEGGITCCTPVTTRSNNYHVMCTLMPPGSPEGAGDTSQEEYLVRLLTYVPGKTLSTVELSDPLLFAVGSFVATVDRKMQACASEKGFGSRDYSIWNLENSPLLRHFLKAVEREFDPEMVSVMKTYLDEFEKTVKPVYNLFQKGLIHGDCHPANIIHLPEAVRTHARGSVGLGIIDFGECVWSVFVFELAVTMSHCMTLINQAGLGGAVTPDRIRQGFCSVIPLGDAEQRCLRTCVAVRLVQCAVLTPWYNLNDQLDGTGRSILDSKDSPSVESYLSVLRNFEEIYPR